MRNETHHIRSLPHLGGPPRGLHSSANVLSEACELRCLPQAQGLDGPSKVGKFEIVGFPPDRSTRM